MFNWFRKKQKKEDIIEKETENVLKIYFKDGAVLTTKITPWNEKNISLPWQKFYKWFFGRTGEFYIVKVEKSEVMIKRSDISYFEVKVQ